VVLLSVHIVVLVTVLITVHRRHSVCAAVKLISNNINMSTTV